MENEFKLSYTASDINARLGRIDGLATKSELPKNISYLVNDSDFATKNYIQNYAQPIGNYALNSKVDEVRQDAINTSNAYTDEQIESVLIYVNNTDIDALF